MASPQNKAAYETLEASIEVVAGQLSQGRAASGVASIRQGRSPIAPWASAAAALAAIVAALVFLTPPKPQLLAYAAPFAQTRSLTLPDQTLVELNRGASIRARVDAQSRQVVLERGEAAFVVRHDQTRPFMLAFGLAVIRDVGTEFDVVRASAYAIVTVREGQVLLAPLKGGSVNLGAGDQARVDQISGSVTVSRTNPADAFAWQSGRLIYHDAPLSQVVEDLNRYSQQPVVLADDHAGSLRFSGVLVIDDTALMVRRLEAFLPIQSAQDGDRIELRVRP